MLSKSNESLNENRYTHILFDLDGTLTDSGPGMQLRAKGCVLLVKILELTEMVTNTGKDIPADTAAVTTDSLE